MTDKHPNTLLKLLGDYNVEVPIVQRDYAQGRQDNHAAMVRRTLLADIKRAIEGETLQLDLNFVYGKAEGDTFLPIDGQQRLTTLFLLYLYAFCNDESKTELLQKFTYSTRKSSRGFLKALVQNRVAVFASVLTPSQEIKDSEWFVASWIYDPTILSCLVMLNDIKTVFSGINDLARRLLENEPVVFTFLEMKQLGMEDSLYIKLNARGKPLTSLENFKARLLDRLQELGLDFTATFKQCFDGSWTDMFWKHRAEDFDSVYLTFFGVLLMNNGVYRTDTGWPDRLDYTAIGAGIFETALYMLDFLCNNPECEAARLVFAALEKPTYKDRVLFHAIATYLYKAKGIAAGSLHQWIRIIKNLALNSRIDTSETYKRAIEGINKLANYWNSPLEYFSQNADITGFSGEQIKEEQSKAKIIQENESFAQAIYEAERHPYFSGQIRSALYYARGDDETPQMETFVQYWAKIAALFDKKKPQYGHLLRRALLTFGDYTLPVGYYKTLCVDDPDEAENTPSLKRLFANHGEIVKQLLDALYANGNIESQLQAIIGNATIAENDWRYCFITFPQLFEMVSVSHLRLKNSEADGELLIIPNKSSGGYNYDVFLEALREWFKQHGLEAPQYYTNLGSWADRYLYINDVYIRFKKGKFVVSELIEDTDNTDSKVENIIFETTDDPITKVAQYLSGK